MKVLFITSWYPREENPVSGIFIREHAKAVSLIDQVAVLYGYQSDKIKKLYEVSVENEENIIIFRVRYKKIPRLMSNLLYFYSMFRTFQKIKRQFKPDIIHAHVYVSGFLGIIFGKLYNIPAIITDHTLLVEEVKTTIGKIKNIVKVLIARFTLNSADLLLPVSKYLCAHIKSLGIQRNCDRTLPNIVDAKIFYPAPNENIREDKTKRNFSLGGSTPSRIDYLLDALAK
ncbi:MAG: Glycosyltransferase involved in cell wall bisynthesis [Candidatus Alkanophagales archaeon MCA70_species_2]|nr:Glycosyltransferase involved in cell wall bisynthesis [Candidatus Alkanophaga liquidiphilum]